MVGRPTTCFGEDFRWMWRPAACLVSDDAWPLLQKKLQVNEALRYFLVNGGASRGVLNHEASLLQPATYRDFLMDWLPRARKSQEVRLPCRVAQVTPFAALSSRTSIRPQMPRRIII